MLDPSDVDPASKDFDASSLAEGVPSIVTRAAAGGKLSASDITEAGIDDKKRAIGSVVVSRPEGLWAAAISIANYCRNSGLSETTIPISFCGRGSVTARPTRIRT